MKIATDVEFGRKTGREKTTLKNYVIFS